MSISASPPLRNGRGSPCDPLYSTDSSSPVAFSIAMPWIVSSSVSFGQFCPWLETFGFLNP